MPRNKPPKPGKSAKPSDARALKVRVKTAAKRTVSSHRWLARQLNDPYVAAAKREGLRSRAAYKLMEIDDHHRILKPGHRVVDLGAAPGGWTQVAVARTGALEGRGVVIAVDIADTAPIPGAQVLKLDFLDADAPEAVRAALPDGRADIVLSDMAAPASGHARTDHMRIMALAEAAALFATEVLMPGGAFLAKVLQGGTERSLLDLLKQAFANVKHVKPPASRADSAELYVLATGFRGMPAAGSR